MSTSGMDPTLDVPSGPQPDPSSAGSAPTDLNPSARPSTPTPRFVPPTEKPGDEIGPYKLVKVLGEGGFGMVWLAEQRAPVQRRVALKLIKPGMDSGEVLTRFEAERQALAIMDHPGIARVYDAGATDKGRPFFAMEFISGEPLHEYCDEHRLSTADRLRLFVDVCHAVQHAHQKGIIHRDLKPSNILVTLVDNKPVPKIIDFGIAKALSGRLTEKTLFTETGRMMGTPEYMSPEQAGTTALDVDTRTDVYSLGVVLYQLLVGALPFDPKSLRSRGYSEIMRIIKEDDPPRLSTKLSSLGDERTVIMTRRRADLRTLTQQLRGDLDWVTARAMEKDRTRRYGMASDLAADIERYLANQPVLARPPSAAYMAQKFFRRHRAAVIVSGVIAAALVLGAAGLAIGLVRAVASERAAQAARAQADEQRQVAEREAKKATAVSQFLQDMLGSIDPMTDNPRDTTVREVLDKAAQNVPGPLATDPTIEAAVRNIIGRTYTALGVYESADPQLRAALALRQKQLGDSSGDVADTKNNLGRMLTFTGRYDEALALLRDALKTQTAVYGADSREAAGVLRDMAVLLSTQGQGEQALASAKQAFAIFERVDGPTGPETLNMRRALAVMRAEGGDLDGAIRDYKEMLPLIEKTSGPMHRDTGWAVGALGELLRQKRDFAAAETYLRRAVEIRRAALGNDHPDVGASLSNLGLLQYEKGDLSTAEATLRQALEAARRAGKTIHPDLDIDLLNLGGVLMERAVAEASGGPVTGLGEVESLARESIAVVSARLPADHAQQGFPRLLLARILNATGRAAEAEPIIRAVIANWSTSLPAKHANQAIASGTLGVTLAGLKRYDEAEPLLVEAHARLVEARGPANSRTREVANALVKLYEARQQPDKAAKYRAS